MENNKFKDVNELMISARKYREILLSDPYRPQYHFVAPESICMPFDPNGAIYWKGKYHLCYIYQDEGKHCWGHASSIDLLHWTFHPPALVPAADDVDKHIFSGGAFVNKNNVPTIIYHGCEAANNSG